MLLTSKTLASYNIKQSEKKMDDAEKRRLLGTNSLVIEIANSIAEAPNYNENEKDRKPANFKKAVIVRNGTNGGNDTIDLQFEDLEGNKFVAMLTATLYNQVAMLAKGEGE